MFVAHHLRSFSVFTKSTSSTLLSKKLRYYKQKFRCWYRQYFYYGNKLRGVCCFCDANTIQTPISYTKCPKDQLAGV